MNSDGPPLVVREEAEKKYQSPEALEVKNWNYRSPPYIVGENNSWDAQPCYLGHRDNPGKLVMNKSKTGGYALGQCPICFRFFYSEIVDKAGNAPQ